LATAEQATGIDTSRANAYVATFQASQDADGQTRLVQIISMTAGKIDESVGSATREVISDDSLTLTTVSGIEVGDNAFLSCYLKHSQETGSCLVTPLLCDNNDNVIGTLETKQSKVGLPLASGSHYLSNSLTWEIMNTGAWKVYPHIYRLSESNEVDVWAFTF
jgi:hypothetical protein